MVSNVIEDLVCQILGEPSPQESYSRKAKEQYQRSLDDVMQQRKKQEEAAAAAGMEDSVSAEYQSKRRSIDMSSSKESANIIGEGSK